MTRSRPWNNDDNAHVEQKNWTHIRQCFGYERHDNPEVIELIIALVKGANGKLTVLGSTGSLNLSTPSGSPTH